MIGCQEAINRLWEYLDGTVGNEDRALLEEHLGRCRRCCGELEFARELRRFLARAGAGEMPEDVIRRLSETVEGLDR